MHLRRSTIERLMVVADIHGIGESTPDDAEVEARVRELVMLTYSLPLSDRARVYVALYDHLDMRSRKIDEVWADYFLDRIAADIALSEDQPAPEPRAAQEIVIGEEELPF